MYKELACEYCKKDEVQTSNNCKIYMPKYHSKYIGCGKLYYICNSCIFNESVKTNICYECMREYKIVEIIR